MSRIRTIKPEFHADESLSALSPETHLLAAALLNIADDEGFFNANPALVKAGTHPLRVDSLTTAEQMAQLQEIGYIEIRSCADGKKVGWVRNFTKHQRVSHPSGSKLRAAFEFIPGNRQPESSVKAPHILCPEGNGREHGREHGTQPAAMKLPLASAIEHAADTEPEIVTPPEQVRSSEEVSSPIFPMPLQSGKAHALTEADVQGYAESFPAVDVMQALREIRVWLQAHPRDLNRNVTGLRQRIARWLVKEQNRNTSRTEGSRGGSTNGSYWANKGQQRIDQQIIELEKASAARASGFSGTYAG